MFRKIKQWFSRRRPGKINNTRLTSSQLENVYRLGYTDGKRDGLAIARQQAIQSLREILKSQNQSK